MEESDELPLLVTSWANKSLELDELLSFDASQSFLADKTLVFRILFDFDGRL